eukprot:comp21404_c1_seq1/m.29477 comp21404_c1_seq1/g.29477  ORF comp21404_c1_seq1/g.29477 comp21404_c1_seq1/m.29477 type:complete len:904 (-) comp21404_c1_seq1:324-3035(-)
MNYSYFSAPRAADTKAPPLKSNTSSYRDHRSSPEHSFDLSDDEDFVPLSQRLGAAAVLAPLTNRDVSQRLPVSQKQDPPIPRKQVSLYGDEFVEKPTTVPSLSSFIRPSDFVATSLPAPIVGLDLKPKEPGSSFPMRIPNAAPPIPAPRPIPTNTAAPPIPAPRPIPTNTAATKLSERTVYVDLPPTMTTQMLVEAMHQMGLPSPVSVTMSAPPDRCVSLTLPNKAQTDVLVRFGKIYYDTGSKTTFVLDVKSAPTGSAQRPTIHPVQNFNPYLTATNPVFTPFNPAPVPVTRKRDEQPVPVIAPVNDESEIAELLKDLSTQLKLDGDEDVDCNVSGLKTKLMPHQVQALKWMAEREKASKPCGGILADDMGLGKTLTNIAHILASVRADRDAGESDGFLRAKTIRKPTLVVAPATLIWQWEGEIKKHVHQGELKVLVYHGPNRRKDAHRFKHHDVVITTYNVVESEYSSSQDSDDERDENKDAWLGAKKPQKKKVTKAQLSPLQEMAWRRVVLDEGHIVKNHKCKTAKAIFALDAEARWIATGTPVQNNITELYSFFRFLRFEPYDNIYEWKARIERVRGQGGLKKLKIMTQQILLRRTKDHTNEKGEKIVDLQKKNFIDHEIELSVAERKVYDTIMASSETLLAKLKNAASNQERAKTQINLLVVLLRLRQLCCHPSLLSADVKNGLSEALTPEDLDLDEGAEIDSSILEDMEATRVLARFDRSQQGSKLDRMLHELRAIPPDEKVVVVCEWTGMLDVVGHHAKKLGFKCNRIDGTMKPLEKNAAMDEFNKEGGARLMLLSLKAGGVGLNLTRANHIFLTNNHWNPAVDDQATDRVYRMGQKRQVHVHRFVCTDSVEKKIVQLQTQKRQLANDLLAPGSKIRRQQYKSGLSMQELMAIFDE